MTLIVRGSWRDKVSTIGLEQRLQAAGCPLSLDEILADGGSLRNASLTQWARISLGQGAMLRSAQAERLALGQSLVEIAKGTGISVDLVLYYLTRFEWEFADDPQVSEFYNRNGE